MASALTEQLRKNLFAQSPQAKLVDETIGEPLDKTVKYAQQTHALLNSQSFSLNPIPTTIETKPLIQRAQSSMDDP